MSEAKEIEAFLAKHWVTRIAPDGMPEFRREFETIAKNLGLACRAGTTVVESCLLLGEALLNAKPRPDLWTTVDELEKIVSRTLRMTAAPKGYEDFRSSAEETWPLERLPFSGSPQHHSFPLDFPFGEALGKDGVFYREERHHTPLNTLLLNLVKQGAYAVAHAG